MPPGGFARALAFGCSPWAPDGGRTVEDHRRLALALARWILGQGYWPCLPHLYAPQFLDDADADERALGLAWGRAWLRDCRVVFWTHPEGRPSAGMREELALAEGWRLPIYFVPPGVLAGSWAEAVSRGSMPGT